MNTLNDLKFTRMNGFKEYLYNQDAWRSAMREGPNSKFHGESHLRTSNKKVVFGTGKGYSYQAYWFPKTNNEFIPEAVSPKDLSLSRHHLSGAFAVMFSNLGPYYIYSYKWRLNEVITPTEGLIIG